MKIAEAQIDVIEFEVPRLSINDARGGMGGKLTAGVLRLVTDTGVEGKRSHRWTAAVEAHRRSIRSDPLSVIDSLE